MSSRLTCFLLCTLCLASCRVEEDAEQGPGDSGTVTRSGSASDFPSRNQVTSEKVFSEEVLDGWGYLTTEVADRHHAIRSKRNHGNEREAFYARFRLAKAQFEDHAEAGATRSRIEALLKTDAGFKNYTQIIQAGDTLYSVSATSNYTFLAHQPELLAMARAFLTGETEEGGAEHPTPHAK